MAFVGVDCSKNTYDIFCKGELYKVERSFKKVKRFLRSLEEGSEIAIEPTNNYHLMLVHAAYGMGHTVFLVNPADFHAYRSSVCYRAKTDTIDASILARFVERERDRLMPWTPPELRCFRARQLLGLRQTLVDSCVALEQSLSGVPCAGSKAIANMKRTCAAMRREALALEQEIAQLLKDNATFQRALRVTGFGVCTAAILAYVFSKGTFSTSDKLVAFVGLDVRVRESGKWKGKRSLTKRGDSLVRKMLWMAANSLKRSAGWKEKFEALAARGIEKTAASVIVARKLLRIFWTLETYDLQYEPKIRFNLDKKA